MLFVYLTTDKLIITSHRCHEWLYLSLWEMKNNLAVLLRKGLLKEEGEMAEKLFYPSFI